MARWELQGQATIIWHIRVSTGIRQGITRGSRNTSGPETPHIPRTYDPTSCRLPATAMKRSRTELRPPGSAYFRPWASASMAMASLRVPSAAESPRSIAASSATRCSSSSGAIVVRDRAALDLLADHPLAAGVAGHLGQVGHADDLVVPSQLGQRLAQGRAQPAADAGVDLVEDQRRHAVDGREHRLGGQRHPRELAAGGDLAQRAGLLAGVGREEHLDAVGARFGGRRRRSDRRPARGARPRPSAGRRRGPGA